MNEVGLEPRRTKNSKGECRHPRPMCQGGIARSTSTALLVNGESSSSLVAPAVGA